MHRRPTIILFFITKSQPFNKKTTNRNNQTNQTIRKTIQNLSIKNNQKTNRQNKHEKLSHQSIVKSITRTITTNSPHNLSIKTTPKNKHDIQSNNTPRFFEYYNIADGNYFRANHKYAFNKDSIQPQNTKQHTTL